MKRLLIILAMLALPLSMIGQEDLEENMCIYLFGDSRLTVHDKALLRARIQVVASDTGKINFSKTRVCEYVPNTNITFRVIDLPEANLLRLHANPDLSTTNAIRAWLDTPGRLDDPQYVHVYRQPWYSNPVDFTNWLHTINLRLVEAE